MLASVSHELITPLNCSITMLQILNDLNEIDENLKKQYLLPAFYSNQILLNIIHDLIDFNQLEHGNLKMKYQHFNLKQIIIECMSIFSYQAKLKNIDMLFYYSEDIPETINNDQNRLKQVLLNLLSNAIKFTIQGTIKINVIDQHQNQQENNILIEITDTGIGIEPDLQNKIFKQFGQSNSQINTQGSGLGLSICAILVKGLSDNNPIQLKSVVGEGSTFSFILKNKKKNQHEGTISKSTEKQTFCFINQDFEQLQSKNIDAGNESNAIFMTSYKKDLNCSIQSCNIIESEMSDYKNEPNNSDNQISYINYFQVSDQIKIKSEQNFLDQEINQIKQFHSEQNLTETQKNKQNDINYQRFSIKLQAVSVDKYLLISELITFKKNCPCCQILAVDDNNFNLYTLDNMIYANYKKKIDLASSGEKALNLIKIRFQNNKCCNSYQLIFMDLDMPQKDGFQTTTEILAFFKSNNSNPPFITACTANISDNDRKKAKQVGMKYFLEKPINKDNIVQLLEVVNEDIMQK